MGCCCSRRRDSSTFEGEGHRLGTADEERDARAAGALAAEARLGGANDLEPYTDDRLSDEDRARLREERLAAVEGRLTKEDKKAMKQKKKPKSDEPLRGPNSQSTMRWTAG